MPLIDTLIEKDVLPDSVIRWGIRRLLKQRLSDERPESAAARFAKVDAFAAELRTLPVAIETKAANEQHYEVPAAFYKLCLGPRLKYSSCYYESGSETIGEAEETMLARTCTRAELADGLEILELGCGWGSLTLWMAEKYPNARITGVSNSASQRAHIEGECAKRGFKNVRIITCDMNVFAADWMSRHFFTGGIMPSNCLASRFQADLKLEQQWEVEGRHYGQTSEHWLQNTDRHREEILRIFAQTYGEDRAKAWLANWRVFFMACAELWNFRGGAEWMVCHYRFAKRAG